jgi:hypothetical protein
VKLSVSVVSVGLLAFNADRDADLDVIGIAWQNRFGGGF